MTKANVSTKAKTGGAAAKKASSPAVSKPNAASKDSKRVAAASSKASQPPAAPASGAKAPSAKPGATSERPQAPTSPPRRTAPKPGVPPPPPPGRTPARAPEKAEELKAKIGALAAATLQIKNLKRGIQRTFYEIGTILGEIQSRKLYEAKGYGSFESFVEREIDLGKQLSFRIVRIAQTFIKEAAIAAGLDRASAAVAALDGESGAPTTAAAPTAPIFQRSAIPPHKQ